jgi:hypothetical protein
VLQLNISTRYARLLFNLNVSKMTKYASKASKANM